jgi:hypothetical protein
MTSPEPPLNGACLCGSIQITATKPPLLTFACHCRDCQKFSASAYSLSAMFPSDGIAITGDVIKGGLGSAERTHYFCASCLNFIYSQMKGADHRINLRTSLLDDGAAFEPFVELMTDQKVPWSKTPAVHSFVQFPTTLDELNALMDSYAKRAS